MSCNHEAGPPPDESTYDEVFANEMMRMFGEPPTQFQLESRQCRPYREVVENVMKGEPIICEPKYEMYEDYSETVDTFKLLFNSYLKFRYRIDVEHLDEDPNTQFDTDEQFIFSHKDLFPLCIKAKWMMREKLN